MQMGDVELSGNPEFTRFLVNTTDELLQRVEQIFQLNPYLADAYPREPKGTLLVKCGCNEKNGN
jgi:hypothetical protein